MKEQQEAAKVTAAVGAQGRQRGGEVRIFYTTFKAHQESHTLNR